MSELILLILASFIAYSLLSKFISRTILTLPILFVCLGYALSSPMKSALSPEILNEGKILIAEITLILVLFADASHVKFQNLAKFWKIPARMLLFGLPLTIALGTLVAYLLNPGTGLAMALLTAALLAPTDAALGQTVVSNPDVPEHLAQTINVESGLNDGLVLPFVLLGAIFASSTMGNADTDGLLLEVVEELARGSFVGITAGWIFAKAMDWVQDRDLMNESAGGVVFLSSAFAAYVLADSVGGNGFIAVFVGGMVFGNSYRHDHHFVSEFMEGVGQILTMSAFFVFGALLLPDGLAHVQISTVFLAVFFLTVVRMLPIYLSLAGTGLPLREKLFLGWFGPRGLASILFTLLMLEAFELPNEEELLACVSLTVALSILFHGISATPLANRIGHMFKAGE